MPYFKILSKKLVAVDISGRKFLFYFSIYDNFIIYLSGGRGRIGPGPGPHPKNDNNIHVQKKGVGGLHLYRWHYIYFSPMGDTTAASSEWVWGGSKAAEVYWDAVKELDRKSVV